MIPAGPHGAVIRERAPAKVNLLLHVGPRRDDGLHELCSLFASIDLADDVVVSCSSGDVDTVVCPGVAEPNICATALQAFRAAAAARVGAGPAEVLSPLEVTIEKRIPVAAGLGGGSTDAAAALRAANQLSREPLDAEALLEVAASVGADVPSQVEPGHAVVRGAGETVEPVALPPMSLLLVPDSEGLSTAAVYAEADRLGVTRSRLDPDAVRAVADVPLPALAQSLENDLEAATASLRPRIRRTIAGVKETSALTALVTGSGPTVFGIFDGEEAARRAVAELPGAMAARVT